MFDMDRGKKLYNCACRCDGIYEGEEYADIDGEYYHKECLEDMDIEKLLSIFGVNIYTADREEAYCKWANI